MLNATGCKDGRIDAELETKERGSSIESSFMTLEQARQKYGGDEATLELMFEPAEALQILRKPYHIEVAVSVPDTESVFHEVPSALSRRLSNELNKLENYGPPYECAFEEDFVLRLRGSTKDFLFRVCLGCDELKIDFGSEPLPRVDKLSFSPGLGKVMAEIFDEFKKRSKE
jgi:hypothetical protein